MTNFIVPIDFSVDSMKGLEWAILFSQKKSINIQMVYVLSNSSNFQSSVVEQEHKYAEAQFKKLVKDYKSRLGNQSAGASEVSRPWRNSDRVPRNRIDL